MSEKDEPCWIFAVRFNNFCLSKSSRLALFSVESISLTIICEILICLINFFGLGLASSSMSISSLFGLISTPFREKSLSAFNDSCCDILLTISLN